MTYSEMLNLPQWQRKRMKIMDRDNFHCAICGTDSVQLNVHHKFYISGNAPWEYDDDALITLCKDCHSKEHANPSVEKVVSDSSDEPPEDCFFPDTCEDKDKCKVELSRTEYLFCEFLIEHEHDEDVLNLVRTYLPIEILACDFTRSVVSYMIEQDAHGRDLLAELCRSTDKKWQLVLGSILTHNQKMLSAREMTPEQAARDFITALWVAYLKASASRFFSLNTEASRSKGIAIQAIVKSMQTREWDFCSKLMTISK